jgi:nucleoside-diphosphate-sugar epimerase
MGFLGDVTSEKDWASNFAAEIPSAIIHLAAYNDLRGCERDPDQSFRVNYWSALIAGRYANILGAKLVFTTTTTSAFFDTVYETDRCNAEMSLQLMRGLNYSILRLATVYGDSSVQTKLNRGIINSWISTAAHNKDVCVYRSVAAKRRHYVYVGDVVHHIIKSLDAPTGVYDVWPKERLTVLQAATEITDVFGGRTRLTDAPNLLDVELRDEVLTNPNYICEMDWTPFWGGIRLFSEALS